MADTTEDKLNEFLDTLDKAQRRLPSGGVVIDGAALRLAIVNHREGAAEFVRRKCEVAAADPRNLQFAMTIATVWKEALGDDSVVRKVISRGQKLESLYGEPTERKAAQDWWDAQQLEGRAEGQCDACSAHLTHGEGYLLDGRYSVWASGRRDNFGMELLCVSCFWRVRYEPRDPDWRDTEDAMFIGG